MSIANITTLIDLLQQEIDNQKAQNGSFLLESLLPILANYTGSDRCTAVSFDKQRYTRFQFPTDAQDFDCYLIGRDAYQMSDIHDHADEGCIFLVLQGSITEKRYQKAPVGFELEFERTLSPGQVTYIANDIGYHALGSNQPEQCVSLHIYTPKGHTTNYFKDSTI